mmetsp:Transcript_7803/g.18029  ORF Transcript_7803/g.18029 Transcript_7803/m.18029 type:complete len:204 (+) Transcript_7803:330-941(+)
MAGDQLHLRREAIEGDNSAHPGPSVLGLLVWWDEDDVGQPHVDERMGRQLEEADRLRIVLKTTSPLHRCRPGLQVHALHHTHRHGARRVSEGVERSVDQIVLILVIVPGKTAWSLSQERIEEFSGRAIRILHGVRWSKQLLRVAVARRVHVHATGSPRIVAVNVTCPGHIILRQEVMGEESLPRHQLQGRDMLLMIVGPLDGR